MPSRQVPPFWQGSETRRQRLLTRQRWTREFEKKRSKELTRSTIVSVDDAVSTLVALGADAVVRAVGVAASGTVSARRGHDALVYVLVTQPAGVTDRAGAGKV